jgi:hypothetical protein
VTLLASLALPARADTPEQNFAVEYAEYPGCPSTTDFVHGVEARVPGTHAVGAGAARIRFRVEFARDGEELAAHLSVVVDGELKSERRIPAASCADAVESMAVIAAIVLEHHGEDAVPANDEAAPAPAEPVPPPTAAPPPAAPLDEARPPAKAVDRRASPLEARAVAGGLFVSGVSPVLASPGIDAGGELRFRNARLATRALLLYVPPVTVQSAGAEAAFHLIAGRALFCVAIFETRPMSWNACAVFDAGQLTGTGKNVLNGVTQHAAWLAGGVSILPELLLTPWWSLEVAADLRVLGPGDHFVFRPGTDVHDVPQLSWSVGLGTSIRPY